MTGGRRALSIALAASSFLVGAAANANPLGLDGYTGKYGANVTCNQCHNGGNAPQVAITGPNALTAGQVAEYTFRVTTGAAIVGMGAAASDGVTVAPGTNTKQKFAEVSHASLVQPTGGAATFTFKVTAPPYNGPIMLWAVGNACNNNDSSSGDAAQTTTYSINVTGGVEKPPDPPPTQDAGSNVPPGGTTPGGTTPGGAPGSPTTTSTDGGSGTGTGTGTGAGKGTGTGPNASANQGNGGMVGPDGDADDGGLLCTVGARREAPWMGLALVAVAIGARRVKRRGTSR